MNLNACAKWSMTAAALLLLAFDVSAQEQQRPPRDPGSNAGAQGMGQGQHRQQRGRGDDAGSQGMASPGRPAQFAPGDDAAARGWHMSRDERRQLRRDVNEAGRDLYPERRRTRQREQNPAPPAKSPRDQTSVR